MEARDNNFKKEKGIKRGLMKIISFNIRGFGGSKKADT